MSDTILGRIIQDGIDAHRSVTIRAVELTRLRAENEALREALRRITTISRGTYRDQMDLAQVIARAALGDPT